MNLSFGFGKSAKDGIQESITYRSTPKGTQLIEDYLITGIDAQILGIIVDRDGACTVRDIENKTHMGRADIGEYLRKMVRVGWITKTGGQSSGGFPMGYPPIGR